MAKARDMLTYTKKDYETKFAKKELFRKYPAEWIIRAHNMFVSKEAPTGRVLDYGCGSGNNSIFFIEKGYNTYGVDIATSALDLIKQNLQWRRLDASLIKNFSVISPDVKRLPYEDGFFDVILANGVLCYLSSEAHIRNMAKEFSRCLRPGGVVLITMIGPKHEWILYHAKQIHQGRIYEVSIDDPNNRLHGVHEFHYLVRDQEELKALFSEFECVTTGFYDQSMFDSKSSFHWIYAGRKPIRLGAQRRGSKR